MKTKFLELPLSKISYIDEGVGETIVLLHGFCGSNQYWEKVIPELSKTYRVIAPDLPGHGGSAPPESHYKIEDLADIIQELLAQLTIKKATMFGHSFGGYITLAFAEKYHHLLNGFSLIHSTAYPDTEEAKQGRIANVEKIKSKGIDVLIDGLVPKLFLTKNLEKCSKEVEQSKQIGYQTSVQGATNALLAMKDRPDRHHVLKGTELPVLLVAGKGDQIVPYEKTFSVSNENITQVLLENSGHMSMFEEPKELLAALENFKNQSGKLI